MVIKYEEKASPFGAYHLGTNLPVQAAVHSSISNAISWGAPVIEINRSAENVTNITRQIMNELGKANDVEYTWHIPPAVQEAGDFGFPREDMTKLAKSSMRAALEACSDVNAKVITFHPVQPQNEFAARLPKNEVFIYDELRKQANKEYIPEGENKQEWVKMHDDAMRADLRSKYEQALENQKALERAGDMAKNLINNPSDPDKMKDFFMSVFTQRGMPVPATDMLVAQDMYSRMMRREELQREDKEFIMNTANRMISTSIEAQRLNNEMTLKQLKPFVAGDKRIIVDAETKLRDTSVRNIAEMAGENYENYWKKGKQIKFGIENLDARRELFATPKELDEFFSALFSEIDKRKKVPMSVAHEMIGRTFDASHAHNLKNMEINGLDFDPEGLKDPKTGKFLSPEEAVIKARAGGAKIVHVHASDMIGDIDGHWPVGEGEVDYQKVSEALKDVGFKERVIHELSPVGGEELAGVLYNSSLNYMRSSLYKVGDIPTSSMWGPSYMAASFVDPAFITPKEKRTFYDSWVNLF